MVYREQNFWEPLTQDLNLEGACCGQTFGKEGGSSFHPCPSTTSACHGEEDTRHSTGKGKGKVLLTSFPGMCPDRPHLPVSHPVLPSKWLCRFSHHGKCWQCLCQPVGRRERRWEAIGLEKRTTACHPHSWCCFPYQPRLWWRPLEWVLHWVVLKSSLSSWLWEKNIMGNSPNHHIAHSLQKLLFHSA